MSKVIESPVKHFPGNVTLPDDLDYLQGVAYAKAYRQAKALGVDALMVEFIYAMVPGICAAIEKWDIQGLPEKITPEILEKAKPARAVAELMNWLFTATTALYNKADEIPNASAPLP